MASGVRGTDTGHKRRARQIVKERSERVRILICSERKEEGVCKRAPRDKRMSQS